jgi:hypothetical protein
MSDYTAIADIGNTLRKLLGDRMKEDKSFSIITSESQITLSPPGETVSGDMLSLFLYRVIENEYLKNEEMLVDNATKLKYPPLSLSLFYLVTPHTSSRENDHILLGKVMQVFNDHAIVRDSALHESLKDEKLRIILHPLSIDDLHKIWSVVAQSKAYKLSLSYEITPVRIDSLRRREVKRVIEAELKNYKIRVEKNDTED